MLQRLKSNSIETIPNAWGLPQYPTPSREYVIITDKVSTETGGYKPLSTLDDIVYTGKDANKYPTLYFCSQFLSDDGRFAFRYWANDRDVVAQNAWNYAIKYSEDVPEYPQYIREYIVPREGYAPLAFGSKINETDLETLVQETMDNLDASDPLADRCVKVIRIYMRLPGPWVTSATFDKEM